MVPEPARSSPTRARSSSLPSVPFIAALLLMAALLVLAACTSDKDADLHGAAPASPPPGSEQPATDFRPIPSTDPASMEGFRTFALQIEAATDTRDANFFAGRGVEEEILCAGGPEPRGSCVNQPTGTVLRGIPSEIIGAKSRYLLPRNEYQASLQTWFASARPDLSDEFGSGQPVLSGLAYRQASTHGGEAFLAVVTEIYAGRGKDSRHVLIFAFQSRGGQWKLIGEERGLDPGSVGDWLSGTCSTCYDDWERWQTKR